LYNIMRLFNVSGPALFICEVLRRSGPLRPNWICSIDNDSKFQNPKSKFQLSQQILTADYADGADKEQKNPCNPRNPRLILSVVRTLEWILEFFHTAFLRTTTTRLSARLQLPRNHSVSRYRALAGLSSAF